MFSRFVGNSCSARPGIYPEEEVLITQNLGKFLPHLRPEARVLIEKQGYMSKRRKFDLPMLRVVDGWCVFFREGCVLHKVGAAENSKLRYKPAQCALFPLAKNHNDEWYVRQWGVETEEWNLFCLNPAASTRRAAESLADEVALAHRYDAEAAEAAKR
jgi:hypothetical protein